MIDLNILVLLALCSMLMSLMTDVYDSFLVKVMLQRRKIRRIDHFGYGISLYFKLKDKDRNLSFISNVKFWEILNSCAYEIKDRHGVKFRFILTCKQRYARDRHSNPSQISDPR